jgi:hypothetical protein
MKEPVTPSVPSGAAVGSSAVVRPPETKTDQYWMLRKFADRKWVCDVGQYFDRAEVMEAISRKPKPDPGVEYVPVRITETILAEYDAA